MPTINGTDKDTASHKVFHTKKAMNTERPISIAKCPTNNG
jgi:hypothetical protein